MRVYLLSLIVTTLLAASSSSSAQQFYYYYDGQEQYLSVVDTLVAVSFTEKDGPGTDFQYETGVLSDSYDGEQISTDFWVYRIEGNTTLEEAVDTLMDMASVSVAHYCFKSSYDAMVFLTNDITIKFAPEADEDYRDSLLTFYDLRIKTVNEYRSDVY